MFPDSDALIWMLLILVLYHWYNDRQIRRLRSEMHFLVENLEKSFGKSVGLGNKNKAESHSKMESRIDPRIEPRPPTFYPSRPVPVHVPFEPANAVQYPIELTSNSLQDPWSNSLQEPSFSSLFAPLDDWIPSPIENIDRLETFKQSWDRYKRDPAPTNNYDPTTLAPYEDYGYTFDISPFL